MKIRYIFGPRAGEVEHVDRTAAKPLLLAQIAEAVDPEDLKDPNDGLVRIPGDVPYRLPKAGDARPPQPVWSVEVVKINRIVQVNGGPEIETIFYLAIRRELNWGPNKLTVARCLRPPEFVHDRRSHDGGLFCSDFGCAVPDEIRAAYKKQWKDREDLRAPYEAQSSPRLDEKADKAAIETAVGHATVSGVLQGAELMHRPGSR
jgi:hypothetical protein